MHAVLTALTGAALLISSVAHAQTPLPEGKGKDETIRVCGTCHPPERGASVRLTREGWQDVIAKMVTLGAKGTDQDLERCSNTWRRTTKGMPPNR